MTYETVNAGEESVRLLNLRCSGCQWRAAWRVDETGGLFADGEVIVKTKSETDTFDPWARAVRSLWQGKKIEELRTQVEILEKKLVKDGPRGIQGLGSKHIDLTRYFDDANLTDKQRDVASLLLEYKLGVVEVAKRLRKHHSTVQYLALRAEAKLENANAYRNRTRRS